MVANLHTIDKKMISVIESGQTYSLNQKMSLEENREVEFKEIRAKGKRAVKSIVNQADEYAIAYLNSNTPGKILWGIRDTDRCVTGVQLNYSERDELRRTVHEKLCKITPKLDPSQFRIELHGVQNEENHYISDLYIVELTIPTSISTTPYFTESGKTWVKVDGAKKSLIGPALVEWILRRQGVTDTAQEIDSIYMIENMIEIMNSLMPLLYWTNKSVPQGHAKKYFSALQEFFIGGFPGLDEHLSLGTDNLFRAISFSDENYGYDKINVSFKQFSSFLNIQYEQSGNDIHDLRNYTCSLERYFQNYKKHSATNINPIDSAHIEFLLPVLTYLRRILISKFPRKFPEVDSLITTGFYSLVNRLFLEVKFQIEFPDVRSSDIEDLREQCKEYWELHRKKNNLFLKA
ncbi:MAG: ATP-binding protein [Candidatus Electrothrix sp. AU1_5]|nr:ATP-binding protein [Candidatus Electrothrix gigas]